MIIVLKDEKFKPFTFQVTIESKNELMELYHRMKFDKTTKDTTTIADLWNFVDKQAKKYNII